MRKSILFARIAQLVGAGFLIAAFVQYPDFAFARSVVIGLLLIISARIFEWLRKE